MGWQVRIRQILKVELSLPLVGKIHITQSHNPLLGTAKAGLNECDGGKFLLW